MGLLEKEFECKCKEMFEKDQFENYVVYKYILIDQLKQNILPKGYSMFLLEKINK